MPDEPLRVLFCIGINQNFFDLPADGVTAADVWQATVEDPVVLATPWVMPPRLIKPSTEALEESPKCVETDGPKLLNDDHHGQR